MAFIKPMTISRQGKLYESSPDGCYSAPYEKKSLPEFLQDLPLTHIATGLPGHKGASVDCYSFQDEGNDDVLLLRDNLVLSIDVTLTRFKVDELQLKPVSHRVITLLIIKIAISSIVIG